MSGSWSVVVSPVFTLLCGWVKLPRGHGVNGCIFMSALMFPLAHATSCKAHDQDSHSTVSDRFH